MTEQVAQPAPEQPDPYLEQHPDAIQDVEQARTMATAGDQYEAKAANIRITTLEKLGSASVDNVGDVPAANVSAQVREINLANRSADRLYQQVGDAYQKIHGTKR